jgi:hypothetical protein
VNLGGVTREMRGCRDKLIVPSRRIVGMTVSWVVSVTRNKSIWVDVIGGPCSGIWTIVRGMGIWKSLKEPIVAVKLLKVETRGACTVRARPAFSAAVILA